MPVVNNITKSFIENTPHPEGGQITYWDGKQSGFGVIFGQRAKTFIAQKDIHGRTVRYTIGRYGHFTPDEARYIAKEKLYMMALGVNPNIKDKEERARHITLAMVLMSYCDTRKNLNERTRRDYRYYIKKYLPDWLDLLMSEIDKNMILARHSEIGENNGKRVANGTMRVLRALFNHAHVQFDICPANPVSYLSRVKAWYPEKRRRSYVKPHQLKAWWEGVHSLGSDTQRDFLLLLLLTGLRRTEAASLRWDQIDFNDRTLTIHKTKNGDPLILPLSTFLFNMLERRRKRYGNYAFVFPGPGKHGFLAEPKKSVYKVIAHSGVKFTCHDLRRTFITIAESLDISAFALKRLINHRMTDITGSYIIMDAERLRGPVDRIAEYILEQVE